MYAGLGESIGYAAAGHTASVDTRASCLPNVLVRIDRERCTKHAATKIVWKAEHGYKECVARFRSRRPPLSLTRSESIRKAPLSIKPQQRLRVCGHFPFLIGCPSESTTRGFPSPASLAMRCPATIPVISSSQLMAFCNFPVLAAVAKFCRKGIQARQYNLPSVPFYPVDIPTLRSSYFLVSYHTGLVNM